MKRLFCSSLTALTLFSFAAFPADAPCTAVTPQCTEMVGVLGSA